MKKMITLAMLMTIAITANAMSYNEAKSEALFLSDKMAYELNLTAAQYDAVYEINLDYLMSVSGHADVYGTWWDRRNSDLRYVLTEMQYRKYAGLIHFYRPITWNRDRWTFNVYSHYSKGRYFKAHPSTYGSYRGGHNRNANHYASWRTPTQHSNGHGHGNTWRNTGRSSHRHGQSHGNVHNHGQSHGHAQSHGHNGHSRTARR